MYELLFIAAILLGVVIWMFNGLISLRNLTRNAWADVDVYLKRRAELIPNLVAAVKAFAGHEQALLTALADARTRALSANNSLSERVGAEAEVGTDLNRVLLLTESYPELRSGENFAQLQRELSETERHIASARQYYNACVRDLNTKIESFPSAILAGAMGMRPQPFFEVDALSEREAPRVGSV